MKDFTGTGVGNETRTSMHDGGSVRQSPLRLSAFSELGNHWNLAQF